LDRKNSISKEIDFSAAFSPISLPDKVTFVGFGSFSVSDRKARIGHNPQNGKEIKIPARKAVSFSVGKALKEAVQAPAKKVKNKK
jgi:DNA-binding protein HU-beta